MRTLFIVNPKAHRGECENQWRKLKGLLEQTRPFEFDERITSEPGQARTLCTQLGGTFERIIAVGGDGTLNEVVNGSVGMPVSLGVVPFGTGNDFARCIGMPQRPQEVFSVLAANHTENIHIGTINGQYFVNAAGGGFDGLIAHDINEHPSLKRLGPFGYVVSMMRQFASFDPFRIHIQWDQQEETIEDTWLVAVGNGKFYGGGMKVFPKANPCDGVLDVCIVHGLTKPVFLRMMPSVYFGQHLKYGKYVEYKRVHSVQIESSTSLFGHRDGEPLQATTIDIRGSAEIKPFLCVYR